MDRFATIYRRACSWRHSRLPRWYCSSCRISWSCKQRRRRRRISTRRQSWKLLHFWPKFPFFLFLTRISIYFCCLVFDQIQLNSSLPPDTDKWATLPKFPHVISSHAAVVFDDKIWVTGGRPYPSEAYGTRDVYAFDGNTWEKKEDLRIPRTGHGMATSQRV